MIIFKKITGIVGKYNADSPEVTINFTVISDQ